MGLFKAIAGIVTALETVFGLFGAGLRWSARPHGPFLPRDCRTGFWSFQSGWPVGREG